MAKRNRGFRKKKSCLGKARVLGTAGARVTGRKEALKKGKGSRQNDHKKGEEEKAGTSAEHENLRGKKGGVLDIRRKNRGGGGALLKKRASGKKKKGKGHQNVAAQGE